MIINVNDYVERYLNDYIVYHSQHFGQKFGDLDKAAYYFDLKYRDARSKMENDALQAQAKSFQDMMIQNGNAVSEGLNFYDNLINSNAILEQTMDEIARGINEGIQLYYSEHQAENPQQLMAKAKKFNQSLAGGHMSVSDMDQFFRLLIQGVQAAGKVDSRLIRELSKMGKTFTGVKTYTLTSAIKPSSIPLTQQDIQLIDRVVQYLKNAQEKFKSASYKNSKGKVVHSGRNILDGDSFSSTINNIFSTVIGESLSQNMIASGIAEAINKTDTILNNMTQRSVGKGKLRWDGTPGLLAGSQKDILNRVSKVDILNGAFSLFVSQNGANYQIEIGTNTSVKWYKGGINENSKVHIVAGTPLGSYFKSGTEERYLAYNVIAHRWSNQFGGQGFHEAYRRVRAATAASFFNEWMTGTGAAMKSSNGINRVQLLMINGKVYSVMRIIRNICDELMSQNSANASAEMPFDLSIPDSNANKWIGEQPHMTYARKRSQLVNQVLNKLTITVSLKGNVLTKYAY